MTCEEWCETEHKTWSICAKLALMGLWGPACTRAWIKEHGLFGLFGEIIVIHKIWMECIIYALTVGNLKKKARKIIFNQSPLLYTLLKKKKFLNKSMALGILLLYSKYHKLRGLRHPFTVSQFCRPQVLGLCYPKFVLVSAALQNTTE